MTDTPRSLNCPNCGAPINFPPGETTVRCRFCDSTIERSFADLTDDDDAHTIQIDAKAFSAESVANPARRFVLKMKNGQPVLIEVGKEQPAAAPPPAEPARPVTMDYARRVAAASDATVGRSRRRRGAQSAPAGGSSLSCIVPIAAVVALAGVILAVIFFSSPQSGLIVQLVMAGKFDEAWTVARTLGANIILNGSVVLIPGPNDGGEQAIILTTQYPAAEDAAAEYRLIAVDLADRKLLWESEPLAPDLYRTRILHDDERIYVLSGPNVVALSRTDGKTAWSAALVDQVSLNICVDCLQLVDGWVAALTDDGTLEVFDAATGESQWDMTSIQDSPRGLYVLGGRLAFMDRNEDVQGVLRTFDPASGEERAVIPVCRTSAGRDEHADWTTPLYPSADGAQVYLAMGFVGSCLQRWDARTLTLDWTTELPDDFGSSLDGVRPLAGADTLYLAGGHQVWALSTASGDLRKLVEDEDAEFTVQTLHGDDLVLLAVRTRGSTRYALWDVDAGSGDQRWSFDLGDNEPLDSDSIVDEQSPQWMAQPTEAGLRLVRFEAAEDDESHAVLNELIDWQTGESEGQTKTILGVPTIIFSAPSWWAWRGDKLWMVVENDLLAFDAINNQVLWRWP